VLFAILILVSVMTWMEIRDTRSARQWSQHSLEVIATIRDLNVAVAEAETGQRGYLLTGRDDYLAPYTAELGRAGSLMDQLRSLMVNNPAEQGRLRILADDLQLKAEEMAETVLLRRDDGFDAALRMVNTDTGRNLTEEIGATLSALTGEEKRLLAERLASAESRGAQASVLILGGTFLAIATLLWAVRTLDRIATIDGLTGLASRDRMQQLLAAGARKAKPPTAALLSIDLDRFHTVNQVFGLAMGDRLLAEVGRRLKAIAGSSQVGRLSGDDFAIYCTGGTPAGAEKLGLAAIKVLARPFDVDGHEFRITGSVGITHSDTIGGVSLRQGADDAMHAAKRQGGNQAVMFVQSMHDANKELAELEQDLHLALDRDGELFMVYQPVLRVGDRTTVAIEALARWNHPGLGMIPPDRFIALAEGRGMMVPLGLKLFAIVIRQAAVWHADHPGECPVINLNLSPVQFAVGDVIADLLALLGQHALAPSDFCIEVTEGGFANARTVQALLGARARGFLVSMDDFGVGYSSLAQLPRLPLTSVKLDRSFIVHAERAGDEVMLTAIVQLAHALMLDVVAEGVETPEQLDLVAGCGCDSVQGYFYSRPLDAEGIDAWLLAAHSTAVPQAPAGVVAQVIQSDG
jgi:diguanylate cyclase (GGDEF)-like protein